MKSTFKKLAGSKMSLAVKLEAIDVTPYWERAFNDALTHVTVKGFRPGAAPKALAEQSIDKAKLLESALQDAVRKTLADVVEEQHWTVIDRPVITITSEDKPALESGLTYTAELTLFPEVTLGDYKAIAKKIMSPPIDAAVTDAEVAESFTWVQKSRAPHVRVARPAQKGDVVEIDIATMCDGKPLPGGDIKDDRFEFGAGKFIPGFEAAIETHKEGDEIKFTLTAPKDYWQKELCGKQLDFTVRVKAVFELQIPPADDTFAKSLGAFQTIDDVKKNIREGLGMEKTNQEKEGRRSSVILEIGKSSTIDLPEILIEHTLDQMVAEFRERAGETQKISDVELRKGLRAAATKRVTAHVIIYAIAKAESLSPTKEEIEAESAHHQHEIAGLDAGKFYDYIYGILINKKVLEFLEK